MKQSEIILCSCYSPEHQIIIHYDDEEEYKSIYLHIHLTKRKFWNRLKYGIKYIFGYHCRFGHWDEFIIDNANVQSLKNIVEFLENEKLDVK